MSDQSICKQITLFPNNSSRNSIMYRECSHVFPLYLRMSDVQVVNEHQVVMKSCALVITNNLRLFILHVCFYYTAHTLINVTYLWHAYNVKRWCGRVKSQVCQLMMIQPIYLSKGLATFIEHNPTPALINCQILWNFCEILFVYFSENCISKLLVLYNGSTNWVSILI